MHATYRDTHNTKCTGRSLGGVSGNGATSDQKVLNRQDGTVVAIRWLRRPWADYLPTSRRCVSGHMCDTVQRSSLAPPVDRQHRRRALPRAYLGTARAMPDTL